MPPQVNKPCPPSRIPSQSGVGVHGSAQHHRQLEAGALPRYPDDAPAELRVEFVQFPFAVGAGGDRDGPIGVEVVHMRERKKRV